MDEAHKHVEKELGQYPVILTSRVVNSNPYIIFFFEAQRSKEGLPDISLGSHPRNYLPAFPAICNIRSSLNLFSAWYACYVIHDVMPLQLAIFCVLEMPRETVVFFLKPLNFKVKCRKKKSVPL